MMVRNVFFFVLTLAACGTFALAQAPDNSNAQSASTGASANTASQPQPADIAKPSPAVPVQRNVQPAPPVTQESTPPAVTPRASLPSPLDTGTAIRIRLDRMISSERNHVNDSFTGTVIDPVVLNGEIIVPKWSIVHGHIAQISEPRRISGTPSILLRPESVALPDGRFLSINASVVDTGIPKELSVDDEGRIHGKGHDKRDVVEMGGGTAAGAGIGALAGGPVGAGVGAAVGGGLGAGHWLMRRHTVEIPSATELILELNRPATFTNTTSAAAQ